MARERARERAVLAAAACSGESDWWLFERVGTAVVTAEVAREVRFRIDERAERSAFEWAASSDRNLQRGTSQLTSSSMTASSSGYNAHLPRNTSADSTPINIQKMMITTGGTFLPLSLPWTYSSSPSLI